MNDNQAPTSTITLTELAEASGIDEDTLLRRFAGILAKRDANASDLPDANTSNPASARPQTES